MTVPNNSKQLRTLPVIMLTSSDIQRDIDAAYRLGANAFLVKPSNVAQLDGLITVIRDFWLGANRFPSAQIEAPPVAARVQTVFQ